MKYNVVAALAAVALITGCVRPEDPFDPFDRGDRFKLEFTQIRSVTVDSWDRIPVSSNTDPNDPTRFRKTVRIAGFGLANGERGHLSLAYRAGIDNGCKEVAEKAQKANRALVVEGFGTIAAAIPMLACPQSPYEANIACPVEPVPGGTGGGSPPSGEPGGVDGSPPNGTVTDPGTSRPIPPPPGCGCGPVWATYLVNAEKLVTCSLGGDVTEPPLPDPLPTGLPEPLPL